MRSVYLHKDKSIFKIEELPADLFAESLGLPGTPKIKFLSREIAKQRKNNNNTTPSKIDDGDDDDDSVDDEFITLKRADHDLPESSKTLPPLDSSADLSKRKLKLGKAKKAIAKNGVAQKLVFDEAGKPHEIYEMVDPDAWYEAKGGLAGAKKEGELFAQQEGLKMRVADVADKQEARNKKRDKKRKRKEKEKAVRY
jgi:ATP-dependent RNA helicase DDX10/DBP4